MAYLFYFLGFVSFYRISEHLADDGEPDWYHIIIGAIWPIIAILSIFTDLRETLFGRKDNDE